MKRPYPMLFLFAVAAVRRRRERGGLQPRLPQASSGHLPRRGRQSQTGSCGIVGSVFARRKTQLSSRKDRAPGRMSPASVPFRRRYLDPVQSQAGYFGTVNMGEEEAVVAIRLKVQWNQVTEAEWFISRKSDPGLTGEPARRHSISIRCAPRCRRSAWCPRPNACSAKRCRPWSTPTSTASQPQRLHRQRASRLLAL